VQHGDAAATERTAERECNKFEFDGVKGNALNLLKRKQQPHEQVEPRQRLLPRAHGLLHNEETRFKIGHKSEVDNFIETNAEEARRSHPCESKCAGADPLEQPI